MNCEKFLALDEFDKSIFLASVIHCVQSNDEFFSEGVKMIDAGKKLGLFDKIEIGHGIYKETENDLHG